VVGMRAAWVACGDRGGLRPDRGGLRRSCAEYTTAAMMLPAVSAPSAMIMSTNHEGAGVPCDCALASAPSARTNAMKQVAAARLQPWRRCSNRTAAATSGSATSVPGWEVDLTRQQ
jgi:hypothetical protein